MSGRPAGTRPVLELVNGSLSQADPVERLHRFQGWHPDIQVIAPSWGGPGRYVASIPAGAIPGENREVVVSSPDLAGLMDQLEDYLPPEPT